MPSTAWFGPSISYDFEILAAQDGQGDMTPTDFATWRELTKRVHQTLKEWTCPSCGGRQVSGSGVKIRVGKVHLYRQIATKGWFGSVRYKDKFERTVWRIRDLVLHTAPGRHLFNFFAVLDDLTGNNPGEMKCNSRGCSWKESGGREGTQTLGEFLGKLKR